MKAPAVRLSTAPRELGAFPISATTRDRDGHLRAWAQAAKDAVALYLAEIERDPSATITLTVARS